MVFIVQGLYRDAVKMILRSSDVTNRVSLNGVQN